MCLESRHNANIGRRWEGIAEGNAGDRQCRGQAMQGTGNAGSCRSVDAEFKRIS